MLYELAGKEDVKVLRDVVYKVKELFGEVDTSPNSRIDINDVEFGSCDGRGGTGTTHDKVRIKHRMICFSNTDHLRQ